MSNTSDFVIRFVLTANSRREKIQNAVKGVQAAKVPTEKIKEEAVMKMTKKDDNLYVCDPFEGPIFDHLCKLGCRIVGAQCVVSCLEMDISLPRVNHPVHNLSLHGAIITCSSVAKKQRELLHEMVQWMGGTVSKDLTECITHLIAGEVGSKKYHVAAGLKKPILLPEWVEACWEEGQTKYLKGTSSEVVDLYKCQIFKGCNICLTGFQMEEKKKVLREITENGGIYSKELKFKESTHLIVGASKGPKYEYAKKWKIHCVSLQWLIDSIACGYSCDESLYPPNSSGSTPECKTSTPVKDKKASDYRNVNISTISNISNFSSIDETATFNITACKGQDGYVTLGGGLKALECLMLDQTHNEPFLDGCKIYLDGLTVDLVEKVRRVINAGGGTRLSQLSEAVTHVLVGDIVTQSVKNFNAKATEVCIVNVMWLVDSYLNGQRQNESRYTLPEFSKDEAILVQKSKPKIPKICSVTVEEHQDDAALLSQYLPQQEENTKDITMKENQQESDGTQDDDDDTDETVMELTGLDGLFAEKIFTVIGFTGEETEQIQNNIMDAKGKIVTDSSRAIPDFAIVPLEGCEVQRTVGEVATICWLEMCREAEKFLPTTEHFLYKPVAVGAESLSGCVITFSQYNGVEKEYLGQLASNMGATCQDYFQRKPKKNSKANTHLILEKPDGSKYEASKKWGIPAVTKEWLFQCAKEGSKFPEDQFIINSVEVEEAPKQSPEVDRKDPEAPQDPSPEFPPLKEDLASNIQAMDVDGTPTHTPKSNKTDTFKTPNLKNLNLNSAKRPCSSSSQRGNRKSRRGDPGRTEGLGTPATPGLFLKGTQEFKPTFGFDTPLTEKTHRRKSSLPYEVCLYQNLAAALEVTGDKQDAMEEDEESPENNDETKKDEPGSRKVLEGLTICVAKKLAQRHGELSKLVQHMGGGVQWSFDKNCTHYVFQGKANNSDKDFRRARKMDVHIVNPEWLTACRDANRRMDEKLYPHALNPNMSLSLSQVTTNETITPSRKTNVTVPSVSPPPPCEAAQGSFEDQDLSMEEEKLMIAEAEAVEDKENSGNSEEQREEFQRQFAQIMSTAGNPDSAKRRGRRQPSITSGSNSENSKSVSENKRSSRRLTRTRLDSNLPAIETSNKENTVTVENDMEASERVTITWDDATSRMCRENALARLRREDSKDNNGGSKQKEDEDQRKAEIKEFTELGNFQASSLSEVSPSATKTPPPIRLPHANPAVAPQPIDEDQNESVSPFQRRVFLFTGLTDQERIDYGALVEQLGGEVADKPYYDKNCTHMIVGSPTKNEKYLAAVASGKWILHRSYMVECQKAGQFIEEEPHELNASMFPQNMSKALALCNAAKRWREQLQSEEREHRGAFDGWKILLVVEEGKEKGLRRILEAGCGVVLATRPPFPPSQSEATHLFVSHSKAKAVEGAVNYEEIVSNGTLCLKPDYIAEFLIRSPSPNPSQFLISDVKPILERLANDHSQSARGTPQKRRVRESTISNPSPKRTRRR